jgi:anti-sigma B factor antagonist
VPDPAAEGGAPELPPESGPVPRSELGPPAEQVVTVTTDRVVRGPRDALVVTVAGEIDRLTVDRLRAAVAAGLDRVSSEPGEVPLVLDLTAVRFLGSAGLQALVEATQAARRRREPLRIVVDHTRPVIRPIELTGLDDLLALYHTLDQALHRTP